MADLVRIHAIVSGAVQGVGFRYRAKEEAQRLRLSGFVRNRTDGTVETEAEGGQRAVDTYVAWLNIGPEWADVAGVAVSEMQPTGSSGFDLLH